MCIIIMKQNGMWDCKSDSFYVNVIKYEKQLLLFDNVKGKYIDYSGIEQNINLIGNNIEYYKLECT